MLTAAPHTPLKPPHTPRLHPRLTLPTPTQILSSASAAAPHELFTPFLRRLEDTVRDDIADCAAAAYDSLSVADALTMLRLAGGEGALGAYVQQRDLPWAIAAGRVTFAPHQKTRPLMEASALLKNTLGYAAELEKIV